MSAPNTSPETAQPVLPSEEALQTPHILEHTAEPYRLKPGYIAMLNEEMPLLFEDPTEADKLGGASMYQQLKRTSRETVTDPMTSVLNRKGMDMWFERNKPEKYGIFFADAIGFGKINKEISYDVGDNVIRFIAEHLYKGFRTEKPKSTEHAGITELRNSNDSHDALGAIMRWGGDEFIIVADFSNVEDIDAAVEVIKQRLLHLGAFNYETGNGEGSLDIALRSDVIVGEASDNKTLSDYHHDILELQEKNNKAKEIEQQERLALQAENAKLHDLTYY